MNSGLQGVQGIRIQGIGRAIILQHMIECLLEYNNNNNYLIF